jgi:hypothetical protein
MANAVYAIAIVCLVMMLGSIVMIAATLIKQQFAIHQRTAIADKGERLEQ